jgi:hypothetical protein
VIVVQACVNNADLDIFPHNAFIVKTINASHVMDVILGCSSIITEAFALNDRR